MLVVAIDELGHDLGCEKLKAGADVCMGVPARLVQQDHLIDVRRLELAQLGANRLRRADEPSSVDLLGLRPRRSALGTWTTASEGP